MSVSMFYRVQITGFKANISECAPGFGTIVGRHKDSCAAWKEAEKCNKKSSYGLYDQIVCEFTTDERLEIGSVHPELAWDAVVKNRRENQVRHCVRVIEKLKTGGKVDEQDYDFRNLDDEFGEPMEFDAWMERFSDEANREIENSVKELQERAAHSARMRSNIASFENAADAISYSFPAVKGIQAGKEFYIAQVPFKYLVRFFTFADESLPAELRAQRKVNLNHAKEIGDYVVSNRFDYVLPSITASVNSAMVFDPLSVDGLADRLGVLRIPLDATILINDGQHRRKSAEHFLSADRSLGEETIPVVFFYDEGLKRSMQIFADLNANLVKPSAAINALYDVRNPFNKFVLATLKRHQINELIDKESTTIGAKSQKVWSLVHWKKFFEKLLSVKEKSFYAEGQQLGKLNMFSDTVISQLSSKLELWQQVLNGDISSEDLRDQYVAGHAVYLESLALAISPLLNESLEVITDAIDKIAAVPTDKSALHWNDRCVVADRMVKNSDSVKLTAAFLRQAANIALSDSMKEAIERHGFSEA